MNHIKSFKITKDILEYFYFERKYTMQQISKILNISVSWVCQLFKKYKIKPRIHLNYPAWNRFTTNLDEFKKFYYQKSNTIPQLAQKYNVGIDTIINFMKRNNLKARNSKFQKNKKHRYWNNGSSFEPYSFQFNKQLKEYIKNRDNKKCQLCFLDNIRLCVHHIDYNKKHNRPNNLITLCFICNFKVNYNRQFWTNHFQQYQQERNVAKKIYFETYQQPQILFTREDLISPKF